MRGTGYLEASD